MKKIIPLILLAISMTQYGGYGPPKIASIYGTIIDNKTEQPVPYATVTLLSVPNNEAVDGIMCDEYGMFKIIEILPGVYNIAIESIGYEKKIIENFSLDRENGIKRTIGTINLIPKTIDLDAINVVEQRALYEFKTDKMVYNASDDIISAGGTAEDVLRKVPMVTVDLDGEVSLRGNANVKILIDGRDSRFGSEVDNIPSSLIDQVEVITSPSAKYDPEGMAGIINIKLKKGEYGGLNGKIKLNGRYNDIASIDKMNGFTTFLNYKNKKMNLYSSLNLKNRFNIRTGKHDITNGFFYGNVNENLELADADTTEYFSYNYSNESIKPNKSFKIGGDFFLTEDLTLNSELSMGSNTKTTDNIQNITLPDIDTQISGEEEDGSNYDIEGIFGIVKASDNKELLFEVSFDHAYDKEKQFKNDLESTAIFDSASTVIDNIFINDNTPVVETYNKINIDFSYKTPINQKSNIEFGYDGRIINSDENMNLQITDVSGFTLESEINSIFKRDIHAIYFEYETKFNEKLSIKPSIRLEHVSKEIGYDKLNEKIGYYRSNGTWCNDCDPNPTDSNIEPDLVFKLIMDDRLAEAEAIYKPDPEISYYPNLNFTYNIAPKKSIQLGISKRVKRPGSSGWGGGKMQIRPFPRNLYSRGNAFLGYPFLKPEYTTMFDISYISPMPMGFMKMNSHYSYIEDPIKWESVTDYGTEKNVTTFLNSEAGYEIGADLFMMLAGQVFSVGYTKSEFTHSNGDPDLNETTNKINTMMGINLPEKYIQLFDFEFGFYWMKMWTETGSMFGDNGTIWANLGIAKSFFNNQLKVALKIDNLFDASGFQMDETNVIRPPYGLESFPNERDWSLRRSDMYHSGRPKTLTLNLTYSFGKIEDDKYSRRRGGGGNSGGEMDIGF